MSHLGPNMGRAMMMEDHLRLYTRYEINYSYAWNYEFWDYDQGYKYVISMNYEL